MLIYAALASLLCSSLIDARLAPVDSDDTLALCKEQQQPYCDNTAVKIDKSTEFHPTIKASGEVELKLAVKSKQPLTFPVRGDVKFEWTIKPPGVKCEWKIISDSVGVAFREYLESKVKKNKLCDSIDVSFTVYVEGTYAIVDGTSTTGDDCTKSSPKTFSTCKYARPNSTSIPDWDIWTLTVSASETSDPKASITLEDAYVVYDAPEPTMTTSNGTFNGTTENPNNATTIHNAESTTLDAALGAIALGLIGGCVVLIVLLVVAAVMAILLFCKIRKLRNNPDPQMQKKMKESLVKDGWRQPEDPNRTATEDRYCVQEDTCLESRSKRLEDENKVAAAETAQKPAPGEGQPEPKIQASQEVFNKGAAGTSNQRAADPQKNA